MPRAPLSLETCVSYEESLAVRTTSAPRSHRHRAAHSVAGPPGRRAPRPRRVLRASSQGVWEKCPIRKNDSFRTFEEVFKLAQEKEVDLVLLGEANGGVRTDSR